MLVYQILVLMVEAAMKFHRASNAIVHQGGADQRVLLVGTIQLIFSILGLKDCYTLC